VTQKYNQDLQILIRDNYLHILRPFLIHLILIIQEINHRKNVLHLGLKAVLSIRPKVVDQLNNNKLLFQLVHCSRTTKTQYFHNLTI